VRLRFLPHHDYSLSGVRSLLIVTIATSLVADWREYHLRWELPVTEP